MRLFETLRRWIRAIFPGSSEPPDGGIGPEGDFPPVDPVRLAKELKLEELAEKNGRHELPRTQDMQFDGPQQQVILRITDGVARTIAKENTVFVEFTRAIQQTVIDESLESDIRAYSKDFTAQFRNWVAGNVTENLSVLRERVRALQRTVREFQERENFSRPPIDVNRMLLGLVVLWSAVFQAGANGLFFMGAHPQGFAGGMSRALIFAMTDIVVVCLLAMGARFWNARILWQRIAGGVAGVLVVIWCGVLNLFVAHYRMAMDPDALLSDPESFTPFQEAITSFLSAPLGFNEVIAVGMFVLGCVLSGVAARSGYRWDDPIPGYGAVGRELKEAREEFDNAAAPALEQLEASYTEWHDKLQQDRDRIKDTVSDIRFRVETKTNLLENVRGYLEQRERAASTLLQMYRTDNERVRTTETPAYFQQPYVMDRPDWLDDDLTTDTRHLREQKQRTDRVRAVCVEVESELYSLLNEKRAELTIDADAVNGTTAV